MSHKATNWAIQQRGLKPATKLVLFYLADRHNPDHGCFPSHDTLAIDCEMSARSISTHLDKLEELNLITRHTGRHEGGLWGHTRYMLGFEIGFTPRVADIASGDGLQVLQARVADIAGDGLQILQTNPVSLKPVKEPCASQGDTHTDFFDEFCKVYPRMADEPASELLFSKAVADGFDPAMIVAAAAAYGKQNESNGIEYLKFSENWLAKHDWVKYAPKAPKPKATDAEVLARNARIVIEKRSYACSTIKIQMAQRLLAEKLVTLEQLKSAGVAS